MSFSLLIGVFSVTMKRVSLSGGNLCGEPCGVTLIALNLDYMNSVGVDVA